MSFGSNVQPRRRIFTSAPWACKCPSKHNQALLRVNPGHVYSCPDCGERRPK